MRTTILAADAHALAALSPSQLAALEKKISPARREKIRRYLRREDRLRCLAAGLLLAEALGGREALCGEHGKPYTPGGPHFNLSHSGRWALLALGDAPVGVDVEERHAEDCEALARVSIHPDERAWLSRNPSEKNFFDLWALKESYIKMLGTGFSMDPTTFRLSLEGQSARLVEPQTENIYLRLYDDLPGHSTALCTTSPDLPEGITKTSRFFS